MRPDPGEAVAQRSGEPIRAAYDEAQRVGPYRVGRKLGRTLYRDDRCIGMVDDEETARFLAGAANYYLQAVAPLGVPQRESEPDPDCDQLRGEACAGEHDGPCTDGSPGVGRQESEPRSGDPSRDSDVAAAHALADSLLEHARAYRDGIAGTAWRDVVRASAMLRNFSTCWWEAENRVREWMARAEQWESEHASVQGTGSATRSAVGRDVESAARGEVASGVPSHAQRDWDDARLVSAQRESEPLPVLADDKERKT